ncbi:MAG: hypothetical protein ACRBI6_19970 [Acidimicrobiales bacterium]
MFSFRREREMLARWAEQAGFACVVAENERARPIQPAFSFAHHSGRPTLVSWRVLESSATDGEHRRRTTAFKALVYMVPSIEPIAYSVTTRTGQRVADRFGDLDLPSPAAELMPDPVRRAFWQLVQPRPDLDLATIGSPAGHQLSISPRERIAEFLPPGWFAEAGGIVNTSCRVAHDLAATQRELGRALDRAGWMCWSLEHRADVPDGLRI